MLCAMFAADRAARGLLAMGIREDGEHARACNGRQTAPRPRPGAYFAWPPWPFGFQRQRLDGATGGPDASVRRWPRQQAGSDAWPARHICSQRSAKLRVLVAFTYWMSVGELRKTQPAAPPSAAGLA